MKLFLVNITAAAALVTGVLLRLIIAVAAEDVGMTGPDHEVTLLVSYISLNFFSTIKMQRKRFRTIICLFC